MAASGSKQITRDMTTRSPYRHMIMFSLPLLVSQVFQQLYNTADTYIVGKFLGTDALAAVSSSGNLIYLLVSFFIGLGVGGGVVIAKYFGAGDEDKASKAIHSIVVIGLLSSAFLTVIGTIFSPHILELINTDREIMGEAVEYFRYYFFGIITMVMYNVLRSIMNALGDSRHPLIFLIISSVTNVILDIVFLGVFRWGVWSAAFATCISQGLSAVLCLVILCRHGHFYSISIKKLRLYRGITAEIIRYGLPSGIQNSVIGIANTVVQSQINTFGKFATAGHGVYAKIEGFAFLPINSFTMAISTFVGQNLGAGKNRRAKVGARFGIICTLIMSELIGVLFFIFSPQLISIFDNTKEVVEFGTVNAQITALFFFLMAFSHAVASVCRGAGKAYVPMAIMLSFWCVFRIIYIQVTAYLFHDIRFVYWAYPITWALTAIAFLIYYIKNRDFSFDKKSPEKTK